jgi:penicillin amidase
MEGLAHTLGPIETELSERERQALGLLRSWDGELLADSAAAAVYEVLLWRWLELVTAERVSAERVEFTEPLLMGFAVDLLRSDPHGWFADDRRRVAVLRTALAVALDELTTLCGPDMAAWTWGSIHRLRLPHPLEHRGDLAELLGKPSWGLGGDSATVSNHGFVPRARGHTGAGVTASDWHTTGGAGYRMVADLGDRSAALHAVTLEGQSGEVGSEHRDDQGAAFRHGQLFRMPLDPREAVHA